MIIMSSDATNRLIENIVAMGGAGAGGTIGWMSFGRWIEALAIAAACALVGLIVKEAYNFCKRRIIKKLNDE